MLADLIPDFFFEQGRAHRQKVEDHLRFHRGAHRRAGNAEAFTQLVFAHALPRLQGEIQNAMFERGVNRFAVHVFPSDPL